MGSGKSTVGPLLAERIGCPFLDLDARIEAAAGTTISEIFEQRGEAPFRELEHRELRGALSEASGSPLVMALGGGAFVQPRNAEAIEQSGGTAVWLDAPEEVLIERCGAAARSIRSGLPGDGLRPLARDPRRFHDLYRERLPFYARAAVRVDASVAPADVVEQILAGLANSPRRGEA